MTHEELKQLAATVAEAMVKTTGDLPPDLRSAFIDVRAALFQRGIYDPVLVRFDTISAPRASTEELAAQLGKVAAAL